MANESQLPPDTPPDPTGAVTDAIDRALLAERALVRSEFAVRDERFRGIDVATAAFHSAITQVPTDTQREVAHVREIMAGALDAVAQRFAERDTRSEREARDNKVAVDAAFSAQKEAAAEQNKSNTLAITKSEQQTIEAITKLEQLFKTTIDGLGSQISDLKERVSRTESLKQGGKDATAGLYALAGFVAVVLSIIATVVALRP